ncbi:MAG TPA: NUDIX domain-containing protein [Candidatus Thermoplasmatota archaeon]|nr:NUDIX domain-containing protein [Candidatus Thermoplasmatota archaeon]
MSLAWKFCPVCAAPLGRKEMGGLPRAHCPQCGALYFENSKPCVGALIERDGKLLLGERNRDPFKGWWDIIGGFLENGEDPEVGVLREAREETGLDVEPVGLLGAWVDAYGDTGIYGLNLYYRCRVIGGAEAAADDVSRLKWWPIDALPPIAFPHTVHVVEALRKAPRLL